jgi:hypothetical protein
LFLELLLDHEVARLLLQQAAALLVPRFKLLKLFFESIDFLDLLTPRLLGPVKAPQLSLEPVEQAPQPLVLGKGPRMAIGLQAIAGENRLRRLSRPRHGSEGEGDED